MKTTFLLLVVLVTTTAKADEFISHFVNVGQADATILEFSKGIVMIDVGGENNAVRESQDSLESYMTKLFSRRNNKTIDVLILTHNHADHVSLIGWLSTNYKIKRIITTNYELWKRKDVIKAANDEGVTLELIDYKLMDKLMPNGFSVDISKLVDGEVIPKLVLYSGQIDTVKQEVNNVKFTESEFKGTANNHSIVCKLTFGEASMLFTGDLELEGIKYLLAKYDKNPDIFEVDFYHVGHHGAENGTNKELLERLKPKVAIISAGNPKHINSGSANQHAHPRKKTVKRLNDFETIQKSNITKMVLVYAKFKAKPAPIEITKEIHCTCWRGSLSFKINSDGSYLQN